MYLVILLPYSNDNVNTGHGVTNFTDESLAVQTPPVNFILLNQSVSEHNTLWSNAIRLAMKN